MQNESIYWDGMGKKSDCSFYNIWKYFTAVFSGKLYTKYFSCFFVNWFMWTKFEIKHWKHLKGKKDLFSCEIWKKWETKRNSETSANKVIGIKWFYMRSTGHKVLGVSGLFILQISLWKLMHGGKHGTWKKIIHYWTILDKRITQITNSSCTKGQVWSCHQNCELSAKMLLLKNIYEILLSKIGIWDSYLYSREEKRKPTQQRSIFTTEHL